jgi:putative ABC transport system permease protein
MSALALAWRNLVRQKRRSFLMIAVVGFGFAAFALAGGFIAQTFEALKEGTIRSVGHLQIIDRRAVAKAEEATLEYGIPDARRAQALAAGDPAVQAVLPRIDFVGLATNGTRSVPFLGVGVDPAPKRRHTGLRPVVSGEACQATATTLVLGTARRRLESSPEIMTLRRPGRLNAVNAIVSGLVDVHIKELNDRYLAGGIGLVSRLLQTSETVSKLVIFLEPKAGEDEAATRLEKAFGGGFRPPFVLEELAVFYGQVLCTSVFLVSAVRS